LTLLSTLASGLLLLRHLRLFFDFLDNRRFLFLLLFFFCLDFHQVSCNFLIFALSDVLVAHLGTEVCHLGHRKLWHVQLGLLWLFSFLGRSSLLGWWLVLFLLGLFGGIDLLLSLPLLERLSFQLSLLLFSLNFEQLLDFLFARFFEYFEDAADVSLKVIVEVVHRIRMPLDNLDVFVVVVSVSSLDGVQDFKACFKFVIELHVVNGMSHFLHTFLKVLLLGSGDLVMLISALSQRNLEIDLGLLEFIFVLVELLGELLEEVDDIL